MSRKHPFDADALASLLYWIKEREAIRAKHDAKEPLPWTVDTILRTYRFCNVDRNDDTVTQWIHQNWLHQYSGDKDLWFAMVVARLLNLPASLAAVQKDVFTKYDVRFNPNGFANVLDARKATEKIFNGAYIVSTNGHAMDKVKYITERVLGPLWEFRVKIRPTDSDSLHTFHERLTKYDGLGSFMAAQVVGDIKYDKSGPLSEAIDWRTWAASGPGSRRGMNRLFGRLAIAPYKESVWRYDMETLYGVIHNLSETRLGVHKEKLTAQNLQNCLCEFDKYMRAINGEGKPKQTYKPAPWQV